MTFSDTEMKELDRGTSNNTHNIASLIRTPQVCIRHLADGHTHTHTQTHEQAKYNASSNSWLFNCYKINESVGVFVNF